MVFMGNLSLRLSGGLPSLWITLLGMCLNSATAGLWSSFKSVEFVIKAPNRQLITHHISKIIKFI
jgi:hypothetical protein